jgi:hypothetical protein
MAAPPPVADALTADLESSFLADFADDIRKGGDPEDPCSEVRARQEQPRARLLATSCRCPRHTLCLHQHQPSDVTTTKVVADQQMLDPKQLAGRAAGVAAVRGVRGPAGRPRAPAAVAQPARPRGLRLRGLAVWHRRGAAGGPRLAPASRCCRLSIPWSGILGAPAWLCHSVLHNLVCHPAVCAHCSGRSRACRARTVHMFLSSTHR